MHYSWNKLLSLPCREPCWVTSESLSPSDSRSEGASHFLPFVVHFRAAPHLFLLCLTRAFFFSPTSLLILPSRVFQFYFREAQTWPHAPLANQLREREFVIEVLSQQNLVDPWACSLGMTKCHLEQMHRKVRVVDVFLHEGLKWGRCNLPAVSTGIPEKLITPDISGTEKLCEHALCGVSEHASLTLEPIQRWAGWMGRDCLINTRSQVWSLKQPVHLVKVSLIKTVNASGQIVENVWHEQGCVI